MFLIYRKGGVDNPETFGQIACAARLSEGWRPYGQDPCEVGRPRKNKDEVQAAGLGNVGNPHPSVRATEARTSTLP